MEKILQKLKKVLKKIKISKVVIYLLLTIGLLLILLTNYIREAFDNVTIEQLLYSIKTAEGTSNTMFINGAIYILPRLLIIYIIIIICVFISKKFIKLKTSINININIKSKNLKIQVIPLTKTLKIIFIIIFLLICISYVCFEFKIYSYLISNTNSKLYEKNYIISNDVKAPNKKQNLIYIYIESLETSLFTDRNGGDFNKSVIPNLERLAEDNINFSADKNILGGAVMPYGTNWTIAGMVASTAGIPLKLPLTDVNQYTGYGEFLPGAYNLGDILEENGYNNYLMLGSDATFGGRRDYFTYHGNYKIMDLYYAKKQGYIDNNYYTWWGYEDSKLYDFAEKELLKIADTGKPFNFTMLTADTHATDGYLDKKCGQPFEEKYLNTYYCADYLLNNFIEWLKKQDFYDNTTIVISGDHLTMQGNYMEMFNGESFNSRKVYYVIINPKIKENNFKSQEYTTFDFYPTTLAALGFQIQGDRLGLGTNLFSNKETLITAFNGIDNLNEELEKKSNYYNKKILGTSYEKLKNEELKKNTTDED